MKDINFTIGTDPEFFVKDVFTDKIVSAAGIFSCTKKNPLSQWKGDNKSGTYGTFLISTDNVAMEIAAPYQSTLNRFQASVRMSKEILQQFIKGRNLELVLNKNSHMFNTEDLMHPDAQVFGCDPDFCVYTLKYKRPPSSKVLDKKGLSNLRTVGAHIHIGWKEKNYKIDKIILGRILDHQIGLWSIPYDPPFPRRVLYGRAGSIRLKTYGIEYRTPGNFWVSSDDMVKEIYERVKASLLIANDKKSKEYKEILENMKDTRMRVDGREDLLRKNENENIRIPA